MAVALTAPLVAAALALSPTGNPGGESAADGSADGTGSALISRRTLAERLTVAGTIGFAGESTVVGRLSGTVTWLPEVGDVVRLGEPLYEIAGEPVVLMYGEVPAYRDLGEGIADGEDVRQLEEGLSALGFEPGEVDEEFSAATAAAVSAWQEDLGLEVTGEVELGRAAFLPGPRRITDVEVTLGESIGSGGGGGAMVGATGAEPGMVLAAYEPPAVDPGIESPERSPDSPPDEGPEPDPGSDGGRDRDPPAGERPDGGGPDGEGRGEPTAQTPPAGNPEAEGGGEEARGEEGEAASVPVLGASSTRRVVTAELEPDQQSMAQRGQSVVVVLPDGSETRGEVRRLAAAEESGEEGAPGAESEAGVEVTVGLVDGKGVPALEGATVSVVFTQRVRRGVLSVPVTALLAIGGGRYAVVLEGSGGRRIEVTPGLSADGYVEVSGKGLREGMRVETGE